MLAQVTELEYLKLGKFNIWTQVRYEGHDSRPKRKIIDTHFVKNSEVHASKDHNCSDQESGPPIAIFCSTLLSSFTRKEQTKDIHKMKGDTMRFQLLNSVGSNQCHGRLQQNGIGWG